MRPRDIFNEIKKDIIGQDDVLKYVAVAIFKHACGDKFGNIIMIGNSGTGKTSIMKSMERMYMTNPFFEKHRVVVRMNANSLANEEGEVITGAQLFKTLQDRATQLLGKNATLEKMQEYIEHATVCIDEIDKITSYVGGKPNVVGINIQQSVLTLMEGETVVFETKLLKDGQFKDYQMNIDTGNMLFICGGAFEELYNQVYARVFEEGKQDKLTKMVMSDDGKVSFEQIFTLKSNITQEDIFEYGMLPQFISRFDNAIVLGDLSPDDLEIIFTEPDQSVFNLSKKYFRQFKIELSITKKAKRLIAIEASKLSRTGARALKDVYGRIIKPFEFDPFEHEQVRELGQDQYELTIDEKIVKNALGLK
ncbi:MAG TPA: AAA family ATPase [bacterium]|nr:AAA family ATPase [bacterium]